MAESPTRLLEQYDLKIPGESHFQTLYYLAICLWDGGDVVIPDYQRARVWTPDQSERWVGHFIAGGINAPIFLNYQRGKYEVVDGQQRITAFRDFWHGKIGARMLNGDLIQFGDLTILDVRQVKRQGGCTTITGTWDRQMALSIYLRVNGGVPHTAAELRRVHDLYLEAGGAKMKGLRPGILRESKRVDPGLRTTDGKRWSTTT